MEIDMTRGQRMYNDWKKKERMRHQFQSVPTEVMRRMVVAAGMSAYTEFVQPEREVPELTDAQRRLYSAPMPLVNQPDNEEQQ
jgi:hypothetical protein